MYDKVYFLKTCIQQVDEELVWTVWIYDVLKMKPASFLR